MNELECQEFVELVAAFLDGELDDEGERRFVDHVALCDGCDRYLDQYRQTIRSLGGLPTDGLPAEARAALLEAFRNQSG